MKMPTFTLICCAIVLLSYGSVFAQVAFDASAGGSIIPGWDSRTCGSGAPEGAIRYNSGTSCAEYCDGSNWTCPDSSGGCTVIWDSLDDLTNTSQSSVEASAIEYVSISGCTSTDVSVTGESSAAYRICSNSDCSAVAHTYTSASGSIDHGEYIQAQMTSGASPRQHQNSNLYSWQCGDRLERDNGEHSCLCSTHTNTG